MGASVSQIEKDLFYLSMSLYWLKVFLELFLMSVFGWLDLILRLLVLGLHISALWLLLHQLPELSWLETLEHTLVLCWLGLAESFIHSFHPCLFLADISLINCSPLWVNICDRLPENIFSNSSSTIRSIIALSVASRPSASAISVSDPACLSTRLIKL